MIKTWPDVSAAVKKANKVESPPSVESVKKAFGGRAKKVGRESAGKKKLRKKEWKEKGQRRKKSKNKNKN